MQNSKLKKTVVPVYSFLFHYKIFFLLAGVFLVFFFGVTIGYWYRSSTRPLISLAKPLREGQTGLINPLLLCNQAARPSKEISSLHDMLNVKIENLLNTKNVDDIGFYFNDLNSAQGIGINEDEKFEPSSMLKVAVMMVYFKQAETDPTLLQQKIVDTDTSGINSVIYFQPKEVIEVGQSYTIDDLIRRMIEFSDNSATFLLASHVSKNMLASIYTELDIDNPYVLPKIEDFMSTRKFSTLFRVLYNATYLSREMSSKALNLLTYNKDFPQGIHGGLPANMVVAEKYGENTIDAKKELHDCGIVYYPGRPYLLCIMTKGDNYDTLASVIQTLSATVYQKVKYDSK